MIKVIIIDDDIEMLIGLKDIIDWKQYGYTVIGVAENGDKALDIIEEYKPEVIITDITMPEMDGFDLINKAKDIVPDIKYIILTCHEDFSNAKQALNIKAYDYIVKYMLTKESLIEVLLRLKESIEHENNLNTEILRTDELINDNKETLKQNLLMEIINHTCEESNDVLHIYKKAQTMKIKLPDNVYVLFSLYIDNFNHNIINSKIQNEKLLYFSMQNIFDDIFRDYHNYSYFDYSNDTKLILFWRDIANSSSVDNFLNYKLHQYQKCISDYLNIEVSICISGEYNNLFQISKALNDCKILRDEYFYTGDSSIISGKYKKWSEGDALYNKYNNDWINILFTNNYEKMMCFIDSISLESIKLNYLPSTVKKLFNDLIIDIKSEANKSGIVINCVSEFDTMEGCIQSVKNAILVYTQEISCKFDNNFRPDIIIVLNYIEVNLQRHITCEGMSQYINMNTSYFSRLFKKETGLTFSDYLISKRIEKATLLLKHSQISIEDIASSVGFVNISYFYKAYKKITGKTPGETRNNKEATK
ncbi:MAG: response regulator transcription factor [Clostridium sp.]|uniref:response regulator transcription factor n=1 Tax=Clostridium sp. TaxID=1506 RepID=UPI003D6CEEB2